LPGDPPVPVDADHISIVKPFHRFSVLYARTRDFIASNPPVPEAQEGGLEIYPLPPIRSEQSLNVLPKLIRIAGIGLVVLIGYKGVQALIAPPPPIDQQKLEKKVEEEGKQGERRHHEEMEEIRAVRLAVAIEYGVSPEVLRPLFENLGMIGLTPDQIREKAPEAIRAILARASEKIEPSKDGADIDKTIATSRAKLAGLHTAGAEAILDKKIAQEEAERRKRLIPLLAEKAAVARLSYDYPTAKATLEDLLRRDPNRVWSWIDLGDIWMMTGSLDEAAKAFQAAGDAARRTNDERDLAASYERIGDVQVEQGDLNAALKSYSDDLAIADRLAKSDPGNAGWQRDLSVSYNKVGDVQVAQGDLAGALKSYSDSLAIRDRLAASDPGNAGWQRDLSVSYDNVGDVQVAQGDLKAALKSYSDSFTIYPGNGGWQRDLSVSYNKVGGVQVAQGDLKAALKSYKDGLAIADRLAMSDPGNAGWQRDLSVSCDNVGDVQVAQGDLKAALKSYSDSLAIRERLAASDPGNAGWQRDLSVSYNKVVQVAQGDLKAALQSYADGLAIRERLAASDPSNTQWQFDLGISNERFGNVQVAQGDLAAALKSYEAKRDIVSRLAQKDPNSKDRGRGSEPSSSDWLDIVPALLANCLAQGTRHRASRSRPRDRAASPHCRGLFAPGDEHVFGDQKNGMGAGKTPTKRRIEPFAQGDLDGMCAIYTIINAVRALCPDAGAHLRARRIDEFHTDGQGAVSAGTACKQRHTPIWAAVAIAALAIVDAIAVAMAVAYVETIGTSKPSARERNEPRKFVAKPIKARSN